MKKRTSAHVCFDPRKKTLNGDLRLENIIKLYKLRMVLNIIKLYNGLERNFNLYHLKVLGMILSIRHFTKHLVGILTYIASVVHLHFYSLQDDQNQKKKVCLVPFATFVSVFHLQIEEQNTVQSSGGKKKLKPPIPFTISVIPFMFLFFILKMKNIERLNSWILGSKKKISNWGHQRKVETLW